MTEQSTENHTDIVKSITDTTVNAFKQSRQHKIALEDAVKKFFNAATTAGLDLEEMENILGVNEPSIMDLAELSEEDEDIVIDAFEQLSHTLG